MNAAVGSEVWLRRTFDLAARERIFAGRAPSTERPALVLLGGQPAAGKTRAQAAILAELPELVAITGDDLRRYHPGYRDLVVDEPLRMPSATAPVSGGLIRLALDHALTERYSVLLEGTFRDAAMVVGTASRFAGVGYRVEAVGVATPAPMSRLGAELRYLAAPEPFGARWTPPEAHESALAASPQVLAALEASPAVIRIRVHARDEALYDNARVGGEWVATPTAADVLQTEQDRPLTPAEASAWIARYGAVVRLAIGRPGYLTEATAPAYRRLQEDAARIAPAIEPADDPLRGLREALRTALDRIDPGSGSGRRHRLRDELARRARTLPAPSDFGHDRPGPAEPPTLGR